MTAKKRLSPKSKKEEIEEMIAKSDLVTTPAEAEAKAQADKDKQKKEQALKDRGSAIDRDAHKRAQYRQGLAERYAITDSNIRSLMRPAYRLDSVSKSYVELDHSYMLHTMDSARKVLEKVGWEFCDTEIWLTDDPQHGKLLSGVHPMVPTSPERRKYLGLRDQELDAVPQDAIRWPSMRYFNGLYYGTYAVPPPHGHPATSFVADDEWFSLLEKSLAQSLGNEEPSGEKSLRRMLYAPPVDGDPSAVEYDSAMYRAIANLASTLNVERGRLTDLLLQLDLLYSPFELYEPEDLSSEEMEGQVSREAAIELANVAFRAGKEARDEELLVMRDEQLLVGAKYLRESNHSLRAPHTKVYQEALESYWRKFRQLPSSTRAFVEFVNASGNKEWISAVDKKKKGESVRKFLARARKNPPRGGDPFCWLEDLVQ